MCTPKIKRALISVYDKSGVVDFARTLVDEFGVEIISTGGTAALLKENGVPVTLVEQITGFPEMMDGRVKTLHPKIHAAILADRDNPEHMRQLEEQGIKPIDMVVVNLYPFEKTVADPDCTFEQAIEMIDIGGPCLLRAAAKNHRHVWPISSTGLYDEFLEELRDPPAVYPTPRMCAGHALMTTALYDAAVSNWIHKRCTEEGTSLVHLVTTMGAIKLRYGENPHQESELQTILAAVPEASLLNDLLHKPLSFNNCTDGHAALELCKELTRERCAGASSRRATCAFIKHTNACGVGLADNVIEAYKWAYLGDPNAAMGGILACNFDVTAEFAEAVMTTYDRWGKEAGAGGFFLEVWVAPEFDDAARNVIRTSKKWGERVRLLAVGDMGEMPEENAMEFKTITGGMLVQSRDLVGLNEDQWKVVTQRQPTDAEMADLRLAWLICKHTKSNAISICKDRMLIGNGAGQMSRVMSCRIATWLATDNGHTGKLSGSAAASDAFFPFPDGPNILMDAGVTAIIQPGGSKRDKDVIAACDQRNVAMIFTGTRHFKH